MKSEIIIPSHETPPTPLRRLIAEIVCAGLFGLCSVLCMWQAVEWRHTWSN